MRLEEEAVGIERHFQSSGQLARVFLRHDRRAEHQKIRVQFEIAIEDRVVGAYDNF